MKGKSDKEIYLEIFWEGKKKYSRNRKPMKRVNNKR
jgi:hypothetical protein